MNDPILGHILYQSHSQSEAETAYDELLAYVSYMERVLNWDEKSLEHLAHKPKWLQPDANRVRRSD